MRDGPDAILDELLALRCRRGDVQAWRVLVERYEPRLLYYIRRLVGRERDAYDVLQQTWLGALKSLPRLREPRAVRTFLYRIARNEAVSHLRKRGTSIPAMDPADLAELPDDYDGDARLAADAAERVHAALGRLSLPHREVLTLHFLEDASVDDIADVLDVPAGTVKSRLYYAKHALRAALDADADADADDDRTEVA